ncbi:tannase/feruloyl esterase family alpha/beta hydrolase (plasmid) [Novosphingobium rhizosphaerae]
MTEGFLLKPTSWLLSGSICLLAASSALLPQPTAFAKTPASSFASRCQSLKALRSASLGTIIDAAPGPKDFEDRSPFGVQVITLPEHCEITAAFPARQGRDNQSYTIRYHVRLPEDWNGRFLFQGGGGTNGELGNALGPTGMGNPPGLVRGYAVVSQDSGHDNGANNDPHRGGVSVFGTDPEARRDYGHTSLPKVARAAKELIRQFYGSAPKFSYFYGCSKGGRKAWPSPSAIPRCSMGLSQQRLASPCRVRPWRRPGIHRPSPSCGTRQTVS